MPECSVKVMDCDDEATHRVKLDGTFTNTLLDALERDCCEAHISWYRKHYAKKRGYQMEVESL